MYSRGMKNNNIFLYFVRHRESIVTLRVSKTIAWKVTHEVEYWLYGTLYACWETVKIVPAFQNTRSNVLNKALALSLYNYSSGSGVTLDCRRHIKMVESPRWNPQTNSITLTRANSTGITISSPFLSFSTHC